MHTNITISRIWFLYFYKEHSEQVNIQLLLLLNRTPMWWWAEAEKLFVLYTSQIILQNFLFLFWRAIFFLNYLHYNGIESLPNFGCCPLIILYCKNFFSDPLEVLLIHFDQLTSYWNKFMFWFVTMRDPSLVNSSAV